MRFAAKEAIVKAMGTGFAHGVWIRDVGVVQNAWGKPEVVFSERGDAVRRRARHRRGARDPHGREGPGGRGRRVDAGRMNTLVFDIETVPDVALGRRLYGLGDLPMRRSRRPCSRCAARTPARIPAARAAAHGGDLLRAARTRGPHGVEPGGPGTAEGELVQRFFDGIENYSPDLVSWNGSGFDLPVLTYRGAAARGAGAALLGDGRHGHRASATTTTCSRYHWRHTDLMDVLSGFGPRGTSLANMATLLGCRASSDSPAARSGMPTSPATWRASAPTARPTC